MEAQSPEHRAFSPKQSQANRLWMLIIVVVLSTLFLEMKGNSTHHFNCCISTNEEAVGAEVFIDNQKVGSISKDEPAGLGGGAFRTMLLSGRHLVEIKKLDYKAYSTNIEMKKEIYLEANLSKSSG